MISFKYAAASVACMWPRTKAIGIGDISQQNGLTPQDAHGIRHPWGSHRYGFDMDVAYYQVGTKDNDLREVCPNKNDRCIGPPNTLDAVKSAFLIAKLLESGQVRVLGVDGKIGPVLKQEIQKFYKDEMITKEVLNLFNSRVHWETRNTGRSWFFSHHHHLHVSYLP